MLCDVIPPCSVMYCKKENTFKFIQGYDIVVDLGLLFSLVLMGMLVFGSLAYYIENEEEDTGFYSIPQVQWPALCSLLFLSI
jgi:hypothetical protein